MDFGFRSKAILQTNSIFRPTKKNTKNQKRGQLSDIDTCILNIVNFNGLLAIRCVSKITLVQLRSLILNRYNRGQGKAMGDYKATEFFKSKTDPDLIESLNILRLDKQDPISCFEPFFNKIEEHHFPNLTSLTVSTLRKDFFQASKHLCNTLKTLELEISSIELDNLSPFTSLENLTLKSVSISASIIKNQFENLKLKKLILITCDNVMLSPYLTTLTFLKINNCPEFDTNCIKFSSLKTLSIFPCENLMFLKYATNLEKLELELKGTQNLGSLKYQTNLQELQIFNNWQGLYLNAINGLNIYKLVLDDRSNNSVSFTSFKNLKSLSLCRTQFDYDYSFLSGMTLLESLKLPKIDIGNLNLNSLRVNPLDYLINLTTLKKLQIEIYNDFDVLKTIRNLNLYTLKIVSNSEPRCFFSRYFEDLEYPPTVYFNGRELNLERVILRRIAFRQIDNSEKNNETCTIKKTNSVKNKETCTIN